MTKPDDIIATAPADVPEVLDLETLDALSAGAYGGTNTCDPYSGENSCENPGAGRVEFQTIPIEKPELKVSPGVSFQLK